MLKKDLEENYQKSLKEISELKKELSELKNVKEQILQHHLAEENRYKIWKKQNKKFLLRFLRENLDLVIDETSVNLGRNCYGDYESKDVVKNVELKIGNLEK